MASKKTIDFFSLLVKEDLLQLILAVYLGEVLKSFFEAVVDDLLTPIFEELLPKRSNKVKEFTLVIRGVEFKIGNLLKQTTLLVIAFVLSYFFTKAIFHLLN
jgi:large-conductance mechanosensitive channel